MANGVDYLERSALKRVVLTNGKFHLHLLPRDGGGNIRYRVGFQMQRPEDMPEEEYDFALHMIMEASGIGTERDQNEDVFNISAEMTGYFEVEDMPDFSFEEVSKSTTVFAAQLYPYMREHFADIFSKMGFNPSLAPWDMQLMKASSSTDDTSEEVASTEKGNKKKKITNEVHSTGNG